MSTKKRRLANIWCRQGGTQPIMSRIDAMTEWLTYRSCKPRSGVMSCGSSILPRASRCCLPLKGDAARFLVLKKG